jgi:hypothetical protein
LISMTMITLTRLDGEKVGIEYRTRTDNDAKPDSEILLLAVPRKHVREMALCKGARDTLEIAYGLLCGHGYEEIRKNLVIDAARTVLQHSTLDDKEIGCLTEQLIRMYDYQNLYHVSDTEKAASELCVQLAERHPSALDKLMDNAVKYGKMLDIEDGDSYHPNSFDLLAKIRNDKVIEFLARTAGSPNLRLRAQGIESLFECAPCHPLLAEPGIREYVERK